MLARPGLLLLFSCLPLAAQKPPTDPERLALACNQFAADLHAELAASKQPTSSPGSIAFALLMLLPGARGETANEIATLLHLPTDLRDARLHAAVHGLLEATGITVKVNHGADKEYGRLYLSNDVWVQAGYRLVPAYVEVLRQSLGSGQHDVDFVRDTEKARLTINAHIGKTTLGRIPDLLQPGVLDMDTRVVLTNAMWFKGAWTEAFDKGSSSDKPFTLGDGSSIQVPTMQKTKTALFAETEAWSYLALGFEGSDIRFEAVVPKDGKPLEDAEAALFADTHHRALRSERVAIELPRFQVVGSHQLKGPLQRLGMRVAFSPGADLSGMTEKNDLAVAEVVHRTWVDVDEAGAEAAAATAIVLKRLGAPMSGEPKAFRADRPFAFALRHAPTGLVLFVGRVNDPRTRQG